MKRGLLTLTFVSIIALGALHWFGSTLYLYWDVIWFDNLMHCLGGFSIGLLTLWVWYASGFFGRGLPTAKEAFSHAVLAAILVIAGWEFFEYAYDIANPVGGVYAVDTLHDILTTILGGALAGILGRRPNFYN